MLLLLSWVVVSRNLRESLFNEVCVVVDGCSSYCAHALVTCASPFEGWWSLAVPSNCRNSLCVVLLRVRAHAPLSCAQTFFKEILILKRCSRLEGVKLCEFRRENEKQLKTISVYTQFLNVLCLFNVLHLAWIDVVYVLLGSDNYYYHYKM